MNTDNAVAAWSERRAERRAERWAAREDSVSTLLPSWRTERRTRLLIRIYRGSLLAGLATAVAQVFWLPALFAWIPFTVVVCVSWTMLRTVINTRDVAPDSELDEYEATVIRSGQSVAYNWTALLVLAAGIFMVFVSVLSPDNLDRWVYTAGLLCILGMMSATALPTVTYATTFGPVPPPNN
jgi:hypothetical protein